MEMSEKIKNYDPILPRRALYICNQECGPLCSGCARSKDGVNWTESVLFAANGPVVNVREWKERFELIEIKGLWYYVEKN